MGKSGEFFTFEEVLKKLAIDETKLKRLVSEGEIRAFREGDEMKFRRSDVDNLDVTGARSEEATGVIDLSAGRDDSSETLTDDLIFDEGDDLDLTSAEAGMATAELSSQDTLVDEEVGMSTEPLGMEPGEMTEIVDADDELMVGAGPVGGGRRRPRPSQEAAGSSDLVWALVMTATSLLLILGGIVVLGIGDSAVGDPAPKFAMDIASTFGTTVK